MKLKIKCNGGVLLVIKYETGESEQIQQKLKDLGLEKSETDNLFNEGRSGEFYRATESELQAAFSAHTQIIRLNNYYLTDSINKPLLQNGYFNLAVFRAVPVNNEITCKLYRYLTISELNELANNISNVFSWLLNTISEAEVEIKIKLPVSEAQK